MLIQNTILWLDIPSKKKNNSNKLPSTSCYCYFCYKHTSYSQHLVPVEDTSLVEVHDSQQDLSEVVPRKRLWEIADSAEKRQNLSSCYVGIYMYMYRYIQYMYIREYGSTFYIGIAIETE